MNAIRDLTDTDVAQLEAHLQRFKTDKSFDLVGLDGFLHGITCLPKSVNPTQWLQMALTEESVGKEVAQASEIIGLVFAYYNTVAVPQHLQNQVSPPRCDGSAEQSATWLRGFARAFTLDKEALQFLVYSPDEETSRFGMLLFSQMITAEEAEAFGLEPTEAADIREAYLNTVQQFEKKSASDNIKTLEVMEEITRIYLKSYKSFENNLMGRSSFGIEDYTPYRREEKKVGRNEPCPCGSGKKFKHCHGR
jgi:yecA family protein